MITRTVAGALIAGIIACGAFGLWLVFGSSLKEPSREYALGGTAMVACVLAAIAMLRRSWARVPLLAVCACSGWLMKESLFVEYDPSSMTGFVYFALNVLIVFAASVALFISLVGEDFEPLP